MRSTVLTIDTAPAAISTAAASGRLVQFRVYDWNAGDKDSSFIGDYIECTDPQEFLRAVLADDLEIVMDEPTVFENGSNAVTFLAQPAC